MPPTMLPVIVLSVILLSFVSVFVGVAVQRWREARSSENEAAEKAAQRTNLEDAVDLIVEIDRVRAVMRELKSAFAKSELEGGVKAALRHPLYLQAEDELAELHDQLKGLI